MKVKFIAASAALCCFAALTTASANTVIERPDAIAEVDTSTAVMQPTYSTNAADSWLADGWSHADAGNYDLASTTWQQGINHLDGNRLLLYVGVFHNRDLAIKNLNRLGIDYSGVMIKSKHKNKDAWFVLSAPTRDKVAQYRKELKTHLNLNAKVYGKSSKHFKKQAATTPITTASAKSVAPKPQLKRAVAPVSKFKQLKPVAQLQPQKAEKLIAPNILFSNAKVALEKGDQRSALNHLTNMLKQQPGNQDALFMYGKLLAQMGHFREAAIVLPRVVSTHSSWEGWYWAGTAALMQGDLDSAEKYLSGALARNGDNASLWVQRALVEQERGNHQKALHFLKAASDLDPKLPEASLNIGISADAIGDKAMANDAYSKFLLLTSNNSKYTLTRQKILSNF